MKSFKQFITEQEYLTEVANTDAADVNEIMMGYYLAGENWKKFQGANEAKRQLKAKEKKITEKQYEQQIERARIQAIEVMSWAQMNGYRGDIKKVWWTARPGVLSKAVGQVVDSRKNPTDVLVQFGDKKFLGVSAKSTKTRGDIGFKNPGIGTVAKELKIDLKKLIDKPEAEAIKKFKLPMNKKERKVFLRSKAGEKIRIKTIAMGEKVLSDIREALFHKLGSMKQDALRDYLLSSWMDAKEAVYPPYIKVTGMGSRPPFTAKVEDPLNNNKASLMQSGVITLERVGKDSVGVLANGKRIMKMRSKFESEKMASSIKFSGDPWK